MKQINPYIYFCMILCVICGCNQPSQQPPARQGTEKLKITDLQDPTSDNGNIENLMSFRVLTYTMPPESTGSLEKIYSLLSQEEVRTANKQIFLKNGFAVGTASFERGAEIARMIDRTGAIRTGQARLMFPADSQETISRTFLQGTEIIQYVTSANRKATASPGQGYLSWVFSARPDLRFRGMAQVRLFPAVWEPGIESIRISLGKTPIEYRSIPEGQVVTRIEEGGVILLGPARSMPEENTLDKMLFFLPGRRPKIQFFVIICDATGT